MFSDNFFIKNLEPELVDNMRQRQRGLRLKKQPCFTCHYSFLGSRGIMTARTGSSLTINALAADLQGQTRLEQGAALTFAGSATAIGPTTAGLNSSLTLGDTFTNIDTFAVTSGTISAPLLYNRAAFNLFGSQLQ